MAQTPEVHHGFTKSWIDFDRPSWQRRITMTDSGAAWVSGTVVILLALASPAAYIICNRTIVGTWAYLEGIYFTHLEARRPRSGSIAAPREDTGLLPAERIFYYTKIRKTWKSSRTPDFALIELGRVGWEMVTHHPVSNNHTGFKWANLWARKSEVLLCVFLGLGCLGIFGLFAWGSIAATGLISDTIALSASENCGFWIPGPKASPKANGTYGYFYLKEVEAMEYAKSCYGAVKGADGCNFFVTQDFPITETEDDFCPFEDLCLDGRYTAFSLSTELISSKSLGINVPTGYKFNRTTTCAPIKREGKVVETPYSYEYYYGAYGTNNWTWKAPKDQIETFPGYDVASFCYQEDSPTGWDPISAFHYEDYEVTSLFLIRSRNNYHKASRDDPIFPAKLQVDPPIRSYPLFYNDDPVATALACVDSISVCHANEELCWNNINNPINELPSHIEKTGYYMLDMALTRSNICNSILLLGGSALDAQSKMQANLSVPLSLPLAPEQWKVEVRSLFKASLARIQIDLRDYMRGAAANEVGFENHTDSGYTEMCGAYKFRTVGWRNINAWAFWLLIILIVIVYFLSWELGESSEEQKTVAEWIWAATTVRAVKYMYGKWVSPKRAIGEANQAAVANGSNDAATSEVHVVGEDEDEVA